MDARQPAPNAARTASASKMWKRCRSPDGFAGMLSSAVLRFARNDDRFAAMLRGSWRVLKAGGLFFCRWPPTSEWEGRFRPIAGRRYRLLDGSERFLVNEAILMRWTAELGGQLLDPLKTTVVQGQRSMTAWVVRKRVPREASLAATGRSDCS